MKNIINIDTFFYDPSRRGPGDHRDGEGVDDADISESSQKSLKEKLQVA